MSSHLPSGIITVYSIFSLNFVNGVESLYSFIERLSLERNIFVSSPTSLLLLFPCPDGSKRSKQKSYEPMFNKKSTNPGRPWIISIDSYRLAVLRFHASLDLRVYPQSGPFSHRAKKECFEIEENLIFPLPVASRLMRNYRGEVPIPAAVFYENDASWCMRLIGIGADSHFQEFNVSPCTVRADSGPQLELRADRDCLIDGLRSGCVRHVSRSFTIQSYLVLQATWGFFDHPGHSCPVWTERDVRLRIFMLFLGKQLRFIFLLRLNISQSFSN